MFIWGILSSSLTQLRTCLRSGKKPYYQFFNFNFSIALPPFFLIETFLFDFEKQNQKKKKNTEVAMEQWNIFLIESFSIKHFWNHFFLKKKILSFSRQWWNIFLFCIAQFNSRIKGHHAYVLMITNLLTCTIDDDKKHSSNVIKVSFRDDGKGKSKRNVTKEQLVENLSEPLATGWWGEGLCCQGRQ